MHQKCLFSSLIIIIINTEGIILGIYAFSLFIPLGPRWLWLSRSPSLLPHRSVRLRVKTAGSDFQHLACKFDMQNVKYIACDVMEWCRGVC